VEKRSIYYKHLLPVLRVNDAKVALDLSGVVLAKYALKDKGEAQLQLSGEGEVLKPLTDPGSGQTKDPVLVRDHPAGQPAIRRPRAGCRGTLRRGRASRAREERGSPGPGEGQLTHPVQRDAHSEERNPSRGA
jgi:hypothetical protein